MIVFCFVLCFSIGCLVTYFSMKPPKARKGWQWVQVCVPVIKEKNSPTLIDGNSLKMFDAVKAEFYRKGYFELLKQQKQVNLRIKRLYKLIDNHK